MHLDALGLQDLMIFLFAAGVLTPLAHRLRVSPVLGFLIIGVIIGPHGLARFVDDVPWLKYAAIGDLEAVEVLAELGVVFLLFMIGLELSLERLWAMRRLVFGLGGAQVMVTGAVIAGIAAAFGNTLEAAIVLGAGFALSSTAIVMQLLTEKRRMTTATGRTSFSILLFQDLAVLPILFLVAAFGQQSGGSPIAAFALAIGQAAIAVAVIMVVGRLVLSPLFRLVGVAASREMFIAFVLLIIFGAAIVTQEVGLSMALGAFMAGLVFAETEYRHAIEVDIEPFKGLLLGVFFVSVGMGVDVAQVAAKPFWLAASVAGLFAIKGVIIFGLARLFGESKPVSVETALLLGQGGEFAFLVVGLALAAGLLPTDTAQFMLLTTGLTMLATPAVAHFARTAAIWLEQREGGRQLDAEAPTDVAQHVVIAGYGRVGQMLGELLETHDLNHIAIDNDPMLAGRFRKEGASVFFGDASRREIMRRSGAERAAALVVTMDDAAATEKVVAAARRDWPELTIYARARDAAHGARLSQAGAHHIVPETVEASLQLGEVLLLGLGVPEDTARHVVQTRRQIEETALSGDG